jgi:hypothetical protein
MEISGECAAAIAAMATGFVGMFKIHIDQNKSHMDDLRKKAGNREMTISEIQNRLDELKHGAEFE